ncbi:MAG: glycosyltransferase family protein [Solimicrobium sp.]|jgi:glycosyltransferase involved in cell wall biosynthesis|nr:glycosyltransferase family protein [Solimicrobium sp.]
MKIVFFTPILLASAIGRVASLVVPQLLILGHEVVIVRTEDPGFFEKPIHPFSCEVMHWINGEEVRQLAAQSDLLVYQIGDNYPYHQGCLEWLPELPGIVCIHDVFVAHLFYSWSEKIGRVNALEEIRSHYGSEVAQNFFEQVSSASFIAFANRFAPMTEWVASMASAAIIHSTWAMNRVRSSCIGPSEYVPLPYDAPYLNVANSLGQITDGRVVVLTIGHVNKNKRYTSVIKAIGMSSLLRSRLTYRIVGAIEPAVANDLQALADKLNVVITITGVVDDRTLANEIHNADMMCCLRWPALESASASTIEAMLYGKPVIVTDTGFYRDLPDECVLKISMESELADLQIMLERLVDSPEECKALGKLASEYARKTFRADYYARQIIAMKGRMDRSHLILNAAQVFSDKLKQWGAKGDPKILASITDQLTLFR